jgi:hypothetical protein
MNRHGEGSQHDQAEEDQAVREEQRGAEQQTPEQAGEESASCSTDTNKCQASGRDAREQAVGRHGHPDCAREDRNEGNGPSSRAVGAEFS